MTALEYMGKVHIDIFGVEPNIIGKFWQNQDLLIENIEKSIEEDTPYDEYELLTDEEKIAFDKGLLLF